ncbi:MAG: ABC transporter permease [Lachnospiraceae bacterium]
MFGQLFIKECRQTAGSLIYWLIVLVLIFNFMTQLGSMEIMSEPKKGQENYGYKESDDKDVIMRTTLGELLEEYNRESYTTYPIGFYKSVTLNEKEDKQMAGIIEEATGLSGRAEVEKAIEDWYAVNQETDENGAVTMSKAMEMEPSESLTFKRFEELMDEADDILGGGSSFQKSSRKRASVPMTYEDAVEEYRKLTDEDRLTGGYARLYSDYMVIFLGLLPVFLAVTRCLRDKRAEMQELIYTRRGSSVNIIASRYLAMLVMLVIPVLVLSVIPLSQCLKYASAAGISADMTAFVKYAFGWCFPTIMIAAAVGMLFTELTDTALAVLVQGAWWFLAVFGGINTLKGGMYGWNFIPRHNTELNWSGYHENFSQLASNRILYASLAVILVALTTFIYSQKRRGRYRLSWKGIGRLKK